MKKCLEGALSPSANRQDDVPLTIGSRRKLSSCVALAIAGASMVTALNVEAATAKKKVKSKAVSTKPVSELELENQQLRQELAAAKQRELELIKKGVAAAPAAEAATAAGQAGAAVAVAEAAQQEEVAKEDESQNKNLGEVVVKAKPKLAKLHDVAQSVSVVSGQELSRELSLDLGSITRRASNVQFNQENTRGASLSVRGLGKRSFTETQDPSVGVTVDGVPYALTQLANFSFYDVDHVEVTRGPRGTEGGLAASAGKVNVVSKAPTFIPTAELSATYGQREALILQGALGGPVIKDLLAWRGAFIVDKGRGFYEAEYNKNFSQYDRDRLSGRVQLLFTPASTLTAKLSADFEPRQPQLQNGLTFYHEQPFRFADGSLTDPNGTQAKAKLFGFTNNAGVFTGARDAFLNRSFNGKNFTYDDYIGGAARGTTYQNSLLGQTVHNQGAAAQINWEVADHVLTSITGVREYGFDAHNDEGTPFDISVDGGGGVDYNQWTQEVNLVNKPGGFIDYKLGAIGLWTKDNIDSKAGWGSDAGAWFATNAQYNILDRNAGVNRGSGLALMKDSLQDMRRFEQTQVRTQSGAAFAESNLHFTDDFSLVAGGRITHEDRESRNFRLIENNGAGAALNPVSIRDVATGGFNSNAKGDLVGANSAEQLALANTVANRYFGKANYSALTAAQKLQVATAKTMRAQQLGRMNETTGDKYNDVLFTGQLTPSYKINEDLTTYFAWQYGEKSGSVISVNGLPQTVKPEETHAFELGLKSFWLDKSVIVNLDAFFMDIKNYQQAVQVVDEFQTQINRDNGQANPIAFTSAQGNVGKVQVHGVELDSVINTVPYLSIRLNGAYNVAEYVDFKNSGVPDELAYLPGAFIDQSGKALPGASKWSFVVGAEYARPVFDSQFIAHTSFNTTYQTEFNNSDTLSSFGWVSDRARTDASLGISSRDKVWDLSLIGKNIFNDTSHEVGWRSYDPNPYPAWFGIQVSGKI